MVAGASTAGFKLELPRFGAVWDRAKRFGEHGFDVELYKCRRISKSGQYQEVRILHISTYMDGTWPEMFKITEYMNNERFAVDHERYRHPNRGLHRDCASSDVLLLGCDSNEVERARKILLEVERGLFGIWKWDMLWYFADGRVPPYETLPTGVDRYSGDEFSTDAINMIRTHIERRYDSTPQAGLPIKLADRLERSIDRIIEQKKRYYTLDKRLERLERRAAKFKGCRDWDLFIATANFLAAARNYYSHVNQASSMDNMQEEWEKFKEAAQHHGFGLPTIEHEGPGISSREDNHARLKLMTLFTGIATTWLDECDKSIWK